jgi:hypothetical protein
VPPNAPRVVDPGSRSCKECDVCCRALLASCTDSTSGSLAAASVTRMTWSGSLRVMARVWWRTFDLAAVGVTVRTWRVASLGSTPLSTA